jgi:Bacterial PH domain
MQPIVVRERQGMVVGALLLGSAALVGLIYLLTEPARRTNEELGFAMIAVLAALGFVLLAVGRSTLTADDAGLTLRTPGGERRMAWESISDFYTLTNEHHTFDVVEFEGAREIRWNAAEPHAESLRAAVLSWATRAPAREWAPPGSRAIEALPRTFAYEPPATRAGAAITLPVTLGLIVWVFSKVHGFEAPRIPLAWGIVMLSAVMATILALPVTTLSIWVAAERDYRRRRGQRVTVREDGLRYDDERREMVIGWNEMLRVVPLETGLIVPETLWIESHRESFTVSTNLGDLPRLRALLARRAPEAVARGKASSRDPDDLLRLDALPGVAVHHYRTRVTRGLLALLGFFVLLFVWIGVRGEEFFPVCSAILFALAGARLLDNYLFTQVRLDTRGITFRRRTATHFVAWDDVTGLRRVEADALTHLTIEFAGGRRRVWHNVLDFKGLSDTLEARVPSITSTRKD